MHDRFQYWQQQGVFKRLWEAGLQAYDGAKGIEWAWQAVDGAMTKAPLGGKGTGPNPTDRGKSGTKRSVLTDGRGVPLGLAVDGANRHDMKMLESTLNATAIARPQPSTADPQHLCLDNSWMNRFRRLLVRWEKKQENYTAMLHFACAWISFRSAEAFGI